VERTVKDNSIYSSHPQFLIDVNKEYRYLGSGDTSTINNDYAFFLFIPAKLENKIINKGVLIETKDT